MAFWSVAAAVTCLKVLLIPSYRSTDFEVHRNWLAITHSLPISQWYYEETSASTLDYPPLFAWLEFTLSQAAKLFDPNMLVVSNLRYASEATVLFQRLSVIVTDFVFIYAVKQCCDTCLKQRKQNDGQLDIFKNPSIVLFILMTCNCGLLIVDHIHFQYNGFLFGLMMLSVVRIYQSAAAGHGCLVQRKLPSVVVEDSSSDQDWSPPKVLMKKQSSVAGCSSVRRKLSSISNSDQDSGSSLQKKVVKTQGRVLESAIWFSLLLNFKHIYLYVAPAYFVYMLRCYCFQSSQNGRLLWRSFSLTRLIMLGVAVVSIFCISFGPFIYMNQLHQVISRLFPFKRGLCHAYWAPNFWALYNIADKGAAFIASRFGFNTTLVSGQAVMTGGLVQNFNHVILPTVTPLVTLVTTAVSIIPSMLHLWLSPKGPQSFVRCLVLCAFGSFMFGWHVHEKAILLIILPLSLLVLDRKKDAQLFLVLSTVGHYSLFPLLYTQAETVLKICLVFTFTLFAFTSLGKIYRFPWQPFSFPLLSVSESLYLVGIIPLELYNSVIHQHILRLSDKLPFLPLMLTSVYCAVGVTYCWIKFYYLTLTEKPIKHEKSN